MANYETITNRVFFQDNANNRNFAKQIYTFAPDAKKNKVHDDNIDRLNNAITKKNKVHDDNIDCLNNCVIAYKSQYGILGTIFEN